MEGPDLSVDFRIHILFRIMLFLFLSSHVIPEFEAVSASLRQAADNDTGAAAAALFAATLLVTILGLVQLGQVRASHRTKTFKDLKPSYGYSNLFKHSVLRLLIWMKVKC